MSLVTHRLTVRKSTICRRGKPTGWCQNHNLIQKHLRICLLAKSKYRTDLVGSGRHKIDSAKSHGPKTCVVQQGQPSTASSVPGFDPTAANMISIDFSDCGLQNRLSFHRLTPADRSRLNLSRPQCRVAAGSRTAINSLLAGIGRSEVDPFAIARPEEAGLRR